MILKTFLGLSCLLSFNLHAQDWAKSVVTQHNDVRRTGHFAFESILTPAAVSQPDVRRGTFTRLAIRRVDGQVAAQPLYVEGVVINGVKKSVLYVVTRKNMVYAFDANNTDADAPNQGMAWANAIRLEDWDAPGSRANPLGAGPLSGMDDGRMPCRQTHGPVGITSTPVIDPASKLMYLVARFGPDGANHAGYGSMAYHYLIAIDITTGQERRRVKIETPRGWTPAFLGSAALNRPGLLLLDGVIYVAFGAPVCDRPEGLTGTSYGWVFAYTARDFARLDYYNTAPQSGLAAIWQSGSGLAADPIRKFVFAFTGNNLDPKEIQTNETGSGPTRDDLYHLSRTSLGESILKLRLGQDGKFVCDHRVPGPSPQSYCVTEHFTAGNWFRLDGGDTDLGSGGPVVLSNGFVVGGGKQGRLYVLDPDQMKHAKQGFLAAFNTWHQGAGPTTCKMTNPDGSQTDPVDQPGCVIATKPTDDYDYYQAWGPNIHGSPAVWQRSGSNPSYLYLMAEKDYLRAYRVYATDGHISETAERTTEHVNPPPGSGFLTLRSPDGMPGGAVSVSSNGDKDGIVWVSVSPTDAVYNFQLNGVLMAFDALTLELLWNSNEPGFKFNIAKFVPPTIVGGKVFLATFGDSGDPKQVVRTPDGRLIKNSLCELANAENPSCGSIVIYGMKKNLVTERQPRITITEHLKRR